MNINQIPSLTIFLFLLWSATCSSLFAKSFELEKLKYFETKKTVTLNNDHKVFVLFWATWCTTCKVKISEYIPSLRKKYKNTTFLALNIDKDLGRVKHYIDKNELKENIVIDPSGVLTKTLNNNIAPYWAVFEHNDKNEKWSLVKSQSGFEQSIFTKYLKK